MHFKLFKCLFRIVIATRVALEDGWQPSEDIPFIIKEALKELAPAIQEVDKLPKDCKEDEKAFIEAAKIASGDISGIFVESKSDDRHK
jgi:hypothetical protein